MFDDPVLLRALERILAVAIGGMAIYFGYRMFLAVPDQRADGSTGGGRRRTDVGAVTHDR